MAYISIFLAAGLPKKERLHNWIMGIISKKDFFFEFSREKMPKKEILIDYVSRLWENISKKGNSPDSSQK